MAFNNPIVAGTALVRTAIKSPNYVPGSTGWTINRDGTAEFASVILRGELIAGGAVPPNVIVGGALPAAVVAYYALVGDTAVTGIVYYASATDYKYDALVVSGGITIRAAGSFSGGTVRETRRDESFGLVERTIFGQLYAATEVQFVNGAQLTILNTGSLELDGTAAANFFDTSALTFDSSGQINLNLAGFGGDLLIDSRSQPRGLTSRIDSVTATGALAAETVVLTLPSTTFKAGRAYRLTWYWVSAQTTAGLVNVKARVGTTTAGANRASWALPHPTTGTTTDQGWANVKNATGSDVTTQMVLTAQPGAGTVLVGGTTTTVQVFEVWDIGLAADYANAIQI